MNSESAVENSYCLTQNDSKVLIRAQLKRLLHAQVAQSVEQRTENPRVGGSIPPLGTIFGDVAQLARASGS